VPTLTRLKPASTAMNAKGFNKTDLHLNLFTLQLVQCFDSDHWQAVNGRIKSICDYTYIRNLDGWAVTIRLVPHRLPQTFLQSS
jgi:hypothetical protein